MNPAKLAILLLSVNMLSCEIADNAEKATVNSGKAAEHSERAADAAGESRGEIAWSRMMQRSSVASNNRREALSSLKAASSFPMKVTEASKYLKAFEFQIWTGQIYDTEKYLDVLKFDATKEFFRATAEIYSDGRTPRLADTITPLRILSPNQKDLDLNILAMGVALHQIHAVQENVTESIGAIGKSNSMLRMIKSALLKINEVQADKIKFEDLKDWEREVFHYKEEALVLLRARIDMLLVMVLSEISRLQTAPSSVVGPLAPVSFESLYFSLEEGSQSMVNRYVNEAVDTKKFLDSIKFDYDVEETIASVFHKIRFPSTAEINKSPSKFSKKAVQYHKEFLSSLSNIFDIKQKSMSKLTKTKVKSEL